MKIKQYTELYKQVIFSLEFVNILLQVEANPVQKRSPPAERQWEIFLANDIK